MGMMIRSSLFSWCKQRCLNLHVLINAKWTHFLLAFFSSSLDQSTVSARGCSSSCG